MKSVVQYCVTYIYINIHVTQGEKRSPDRPVRLTPSPDRKSNETSKPIKTVVKGFFQDGFVFW